MVEVILLQNMVFSDRRYRAGETMVIAEAMAQKLIESNLAVAAPFPEENPATVEEAVKKPVRRTTKKAQS